MKIYAKNFVNAELRFNQLKQLEAEAIDFASRVLADFEFPSAINLHTGRIKGFSDLTKDVNKVNGTIEILAECQTLSGVKINLVLPIPVIKGDLISPAVISINGSKKVFSQSVVETFIKNLEHDQPKLMRYPQPSMDYVHLPTAKPGLFAAPKDPTLFDYGTG